MAVDTQGRIVVAGKTGPDDVGVARYLPDGKLDKSLAGDGTLIDVTPTAEHVDGAGDREWRAAGGGRERHR